MAQPAVAALIGGAVVRLAESAGLPIGLTLTCRKGQRAEPTRIAPARLGRSMTGSEFKAIRQRAGLTQSSLAERLRISDLRTVRKWEAGERAVSGPVSLLMELLDAGKLP